MATKSSSEDGKEGQMSCAMVAEMSEAEKIPVDAEREVIPVPKTATQYNMSTPSSSTMFGDRRMSYGEHKGELYSKILEKDPTYADRLEEMYKKKTQPQYVEDYIV